MFHVKHPLLMVVRYRLPLKECFAWNVCLIFMRKALFFTWNTSLLALALFHVEHFSSASALFHVKQGATVLETGFRGLVSDCKGSVWGL